MKRKIYLLALVLALSTTVSCGNAATNKNTPDASAQETKNSSEETVEIEAEDDAKVSASDDVEDGEEVDPQADAVFGAPGEKTFVEEIIPGEDGEATENSYEKTKNTDDEDVLVFEDYDDGSEVQNAIPIPKKTLGHERLDYPQIDLSTIDNNAAGWGMGPDRDEYNRPITALQYQQEYADYHVDFIIPEEDPADDKTIYLTFDEGYENGFSESILDTLKAHNAQAVFFLTKPYAISQPELVQRMIDEGHILGNHTVNHPSDGLPAHDLAYQTNEVIEMNDYIRDNFNYQMCLFRYPSGNFSRQSLAVVSNCGYRTVFWSFAYADWDRNAQPNPAEALQKVESSLHPGAIYLLHAVSQTNATILNDFLTYVEEQGYQYGNYYDTLE